MIHGKYTTYVNHACRCGECREAWRLRTRQFRAGNGDEHGKARHRALAQLRRLHPAEFRDLYEAELRSIWAERRLTTRKSPAPMTRPGL